MNNTDYSFMKSGSSTLNEIDGIDGIDGIEKLTTEDKSKLLSMISIYFKEYI